MIEAMPVQEARLIDKLKREYYVMDDVGYTDREVVNKLNEVIDAVNMLMEQKKHDE